MHWIVNEQSEIETTVTQCEHTFDVSVYFHQRFVYCFEKYSKLNIHWVIEWKYKFVAKKLFEEMTRYLFDLLSCRMPSCTVHNSQQILKIYEYEMLQIVSYNNKAN